MISIDDHPPPDPSSSHHQNHHHHQEQQQISHDLKIIDSDEIKDPASVSDLDLKSPDPSFSIRDYVFDSRSKNVACNWPFSQKSLQLCLKHGVKNLLPPFKNLDLRKDHNNDSSVTGRLPDEEIVTSFNGKPVSKNSSGSKRDKKRESSEERFVPNSFIVSETMASKVCPVCKTFSSSSNTTLNAHIDQCLSGESSMKWIANPKVIVKHRIKPRKTRLMEDIYETAPHCTVEELDRRNGTSWATNSSFPAQEFEFQGEEEKEEPKKTTINPREGADHEGDVYIDKNGTKVRILSVPKADLLGDHGVRKLLKKKKNNIHKQKYLKLSPNDRKLTSSPKAHRGSPEIVEEQARSGGGEDVAINGVSCSKDERGKAPMKAQLQMKMDDLPIVRPPWACSKRTGLSKNRKLELRHATKDSRAENDKCSSGSGPRTPPSSYDNIVPSKSLKKMRTLSPSRGQVVNGLHDPKDSFSKFSSLRKNLSIPAAKFNLKPKFSFMKKSLNEKTDVGLFQDSSNERSRMEEDMGIKNDVESTRNEQVPIVQAAEGSFMGLTNGFDLVQDNKFDLREHSEIYQDQLCSTNRVPDGKNIFGNDIEDGSDEFEKHGSQLQEVDPIPIPGPPGSFLPSPGGDMVSEGLHSSLTTTSRVQSGENPHQNDAIDRDSMSNSPISTVSNSVRSDSKSSDKLSVRSASVQDEIRPVSSDKKCFPVSSPATSGDWLPVGTGQPPMSFKNDQPCCCSRKEGALLQESSLLRKRALESNKIPSSLTFRSEMFTLGNYLASPTPETVIFPATKKLPGGSSDCDSAASPSKPILRLMGKDLTVVQMDDDVSSSSQQFRPPQLSFVSQHPTQPLHTVQKVEPNHISFTHGYPQGPVIFSPYQNGSEYAHPPVHMRSHVNMRPIHVHGHGVHHLGPSPAMARTHQVPATKTVKEIIIIDDSPENEADDTMRNERMKINQAPFYTMYQSQTSAHPYGGRSGGGSGSLPGFRGGFHPSLVTGNLGGKWNYTPAAGGSSGMMHPSSLSPSMSHLRSSSAYYPSSYP